MTRKWRIRSVALTAALLAVGVAAQPAAASEQNASGGQCYAAYWGGSSFYIEDADNFDSDYCYVLYNWNAGGGGRINHPQDIAGLWAYTVSVTPGSTGVDWQVCKERQNDPDICSGWVTDGV
jgi:hypothetical protein